MKKDVNTQQNINGTYQYPPGINNIPNTHKNYDMVGNPSHYCIKQEEIARLGEKIKTLFLEYEKLNDTLRTLNTTQMELLTQITNLGSIINTLKWTITIMIALFGGLFIFILSEVIKLIH